MTRTFVLRVLIPALVLAAVISVTLVTFRDNLLQGQVMDAQSALPLAGAQVTLADGRVTETDRAGVFELTVARGTVSLTIATPNYHTLAAECEVSQFSVGPILCMLTLEPKLLSISLVDATDESHNIRDAQVTAGTTPLISAGNNRYVGIRLDAPIQVAVSAPGYHPRAVMADDEKVFSGDHSLRIELQPVIIAGAVRAADTNEPIATALISIDGQQDRTHRDGSFEFVRINAGATLNVQHEGYHSLTVGPLEPQPLPAKIALQLEPIIVTGQVLDADEGSPIAQATVSSNGQIVSTDTTGTFLLRALRPGEDVHVQASKHHDARLRYAGETELQILMQLIKMDVYVRSSLTGQPIAGASVDGESADDDPTSSLTNQAGLATLIGLRPGRNIRIHYPEHKPVEVSYQGEDVLDIDLSPRTIMLQILDAKSQQPIPGAHLSVGEMTLLPMTHDGTYEIRDWSSELEIRFRAAGYRRLSFRIGPDSPTHSSNPYGVSISVSESSTGQRPILKAEMTPFEVRGLYSPFGYLARPDALERLIVLVQETELNALVFDMKSDRGFLGYQSDLPLARTLGVNRRDLVDIRQVLARCKEAGIYTIARIVVFKDHPLAMAKPEWAVVQADGTPWIDGEGLGWGNPFLQEVRDYNIAIAGEVAALGFDEIQFDYIRFPSDGDVKAIVYEHENTSATRSAAIELFTKQVTDALRPYGVFTSVDVFGLTIWVSPESDMGIGQRVKDIAPYVDYLCPMIYPSTFGPGNLSYENPSQHPYEVIYRSVIQAKSRVPASTKVRPWLQGYWYTLDEYLLQKQAANDADAWGWCFWNAGGNYLASLFDQIDHITD